LVTVASLDLSAAFDTISHSTLQSILKTDFGITGTALNLIHSYLSDRNQFIKIGNFASSSVPCHTGVPQGSVLGPLLFTAYISPIGRLVSSFNVRYHCYADDTQLYTSFSNHDVSGLHSLAACSSAVQYWFLSHGLLINPSKSEVEFFGTGQRLACTNLPPNVEIAGELIPVSNQLKILGVILDRTLSFDKHVQSVIKSCNYHLQALRHIRHLLTRDVANTLACSLVSTRIDYCNSLLYGSSASVLQSLQRVQNNLARTVLRAPFSSVNALNCLRDLHWLPVVHRINFKLASICYRSVHDHQPSYLSQLLNDYKPDRVLRSATNQLLVEPPAKTVTAARRFSCAAPHIWNSIPVSVRSAESITSFKNRLKTHYFQSAFFSLP